MKKAPFLLGPGKKLSFDRKDYLEHYCFSLKNRRYMRDIVDLAQAYVYYLSARFAK